MTVKFRKRELVQEVGETVADGMKEWLSDVEQVAKSSLYQGHGEATGSLKRSIHAAGPSYNWPADHDYPDGPERGGKEFTPKVTRKDVTAAIGSGQNYALWPHQGARGKLGLYFITEPVQRLTKKLMQIIAEHSSRRSIT